MENLIEVCELTKKYEGKTVLENLTFDIPSGRIVGLLGPNGAGKTTIMKILAGLIHDYKGKVLINHQPPNAYTKSIVSYLPDKAYFSNWMSVSDTINIFNDFYSDFDSNKALELLNRLDLDGKMKVSKLSKGTYEKLQLVIVMSRKAMLYILDEPLGGIDPASRDVILDTIIANYSENSSVLLSTQLIQDVERVFDDVIFFKDKNIFLYDDVDSLRLKYGMSVNEIFKEAYKCS